MTTSGTFAFNPSFSDVVLQAYARIGLRRAAITTEHLIDASNEGNFLLTQWSSLQPLLWESTEVTQVLTQGVAEYTLSPQVVMVLLTTIRLNAGTSSQTDRVIGPLSTTEYASIPSKETQAPPTSYWFNRLSTPTMTFWPVPDQSATYTAVMRVVTQVQDAALPSGVTLDIPYRGLDAFIAGLAHRLSRIHAPNLEQMRKADAMEAWAIFAGNDVENVPMYILPQIGAYRG